MRRRLAVCLLLALIGLFAAFAMSDRVSIATPVLLACGAAAGAVLGYVISIMIDVFAAAETEAGE